MEQVQRFEPQRNGSKVIFLARLSYAHLDAPHAAKEGQEKKYSVSAIVPKTDTATVEALQAAAKAAFDEGVAKVWRGQTPNTKSSNFKKPIKDGDDERPNDEAYSGSVYLTASSKGPVPVLNRLKEVVDPAQAYSGCWALVSVNFFAFSQGSNGVAAGLNAVLKWADGDKLGGRGDGASDFANIQIPDEPVNLNAF